MEMFHLLPVFARGLLLGIGAAVPIGPVNVEIARRTLRHGFRAGFALGCGAVTVDVIYATLSSIGLTALSLHPSFYWPLQICGGVVLAYLGITCWVESIRALRRRSDEDAIEPASQPSLHGSYATGLLMTFTSPMTLLFWLTSIPSAAASGGEPRPGDVPIICTGVFAATLTWVLFFATTLKVLRRWRRQWWMAAADALGGTMLLGFAGRAFWTSLGRYL
jgi:L-lysine exporter family protein LysE/ArgO